MHHKQRVFRHAHRRASHCDNACHAGRDAVNPYFNTARVFAESVVNCESVEHLAAGRVDAERYLALADVLDLVKE